MYAIAPVADGTDRWLMVVLLLLLLQALSSCAVSLWLLWVIYHQLADNERKT